MELLRQPLQGTKKQNQQPFAKFAKLPWNYGLWSDDQNLCFSIYIINKFSGKR